MQKTEVSKSNKPFNIFSDWLANGAMPHFTFGHLLCSSLEGDSYSTGAQGRLTKNMPK